MLESAKFGSAGIETASWSRSEVLTLVGSVDLSVHGQDASLVLWVTIVGEMTSPVCFAQVRMQQAWLLCKTAE